jgi:fatty-acyl-CoA synthase
MQLQSSYVHGAHDIPLIGEPIGSYLDALAARFGEHDALVVPHQGIHWTYEEFNERVTRVAAGLLGLGLQPGARVGIWSQNCAEWVLVQFATARAGLVMVNINPAYRRAELEYVLDKVQCSALILSPAFKSSDYIGIVRELVPELGHADAGALRSARLPQLRHVIRLGAERTPGMSNFDALLAEPDAAALARRKAPPSAITISSITASSSAKR